MKKISYIKNHQSFSKIWEKNGKNKFICIWDTDCVPYTLEIIESIVRFGCLAFISIGKDADNLHDVVDSIASDINMFENPDFDIDTRGGHVTQFSLDEALYEAENRMFDEVEEKAKEIYVFS